MKPSVNPSDVQGNVLVGFDKPNVRLIFFKFGEDQENTGEWLKSVAQSEIMPNTNTLVQAAKNYRDSRAKDPYYKLNETWVHISLSKSGICYFNRKIPYSAGIYKGRGKESTIVPYTYRHHPFEEGMMQRNKHIYDVGDNGPFYWIPLFKDNRIDALFIVAADNEGDVDRYSTEFIAQATTNDTLCVGLFKGKTLENEQGKQVEHFGFRDGVGQPLIKGIGDQAIEKKIKDNKNYLEFFEPEDFVLFGLENADEKIKWANNGSFLVFRRLKQDVRGFWRSMKKYSEDTKLNGGHKIAPEEFAAKVVGRWKSGAPLAYNYDPVGPRHEKDDFVFEGNRGNPQLDDPNGLRTPKFAHIRLANSRDPESNHHRILRRAIPYGVSWARSEDADRGLLFMCYQRDLDMQFEYVQRRLYDPTYATDDQIGLEKFVTMTGGSYFFSPSISALKEMHKK